MKKKKKKKKNLSAQFSGKGKKCAKKKRMSRQKSCGHGVQLARGLKDATGNNNRSFLFEIVIEQKKMETFSSGVRLQKTKLSRRKRERSAKKHLGK